MSWFFNVFPWYLENISLKQKLFAEKTTNLILRDKLTLKDERIDTLKGELVACRQPGDPATAMLANLAHIEPKAQYWWQIEKALISHFKVDVSVVPVTTQEHHEWYSPTLIQIVKHPNYISRNRDMDYKTFATRADAVAAINSIWTVFVSYLAEYMDCEDKAELARILLIMIYGANCIAYCESEWTDPYHGPMAHAWLACYIPNGESIKWEPETNRIYAFEEEHMPDPYKTENMRIYRR